MNHIGRFKTAWLLKKSFGTQMFTKAVLQQEVLAFPLRLNFTVLEMLLTFACGKAGEFSFNAILLTSNNSSVLETFMKRFVHTTSWY